MYLSSLKKLLAPGTSVVAICHTITPYDLVRPMRVPFVWMSKIMVRQPSHTQTVGMYLVYIWGEGFETLNAIHV